MTDTLGPAEPRTVAPTFGTTPGSTPPAPPAAGPLLSPEAVRRAILADLNQDVGVPAGHRGGATIFLNGGVLEVATAMRVREQGTFRWDLGAVVRQPLVGGGTSVGVLSRMTW